MNKKNYFAGSAYFKMIPYEKESDIYLALDGILKQGQKALLIIHNSKFTIQNDDYFELTSGLVNK